MTTSLYIQRDPLPKYIIRRIEICTNVRITPLFKQSPSALLKLPNILKQLKENTDSLKSSHSKLLYEMISRSFLFTNQQNQSKLKKQKTKSQSEINMFIGSTLFEGKRDDVKHALQLYNHIEKVCSLKCYLLSKHVKTRNIAKHISDETRMFNQNPRNSKSYFTSIIIGKSQSIL